MEISVLYTFSLFVVTVSMETVATLSACCVGVIRKAVGKHDRMVKVAVVVSSTELM